MLPCLCGALNNHQSTAVGQFLYLVTMTSALPKRGPTVLVTDAREPNRQPRPPIGQRAGTGVISVDSILQYAGDIPSAQRRGPPNQRPTQPTRTPSGRHPLDPKLTGRLIPPH